MGVALVARPPDDFAPLLDLERLTKSLQSPLIAHPGDRVLVRVEPWDPERVLALEGTDPAHPDYVLAALRVVQRAVHRRRFERLVEEVGFGDGHHWSEHLPGPHVADLRDVGPHPISRLQQSQRSRIPAPPARRDEAVANHVRPP